MAEIPNDTSDGYWFQKKDVGGGDHYYLQSVFNKKHLIKQNVQRKVIFILGDLGEGVEVTDVSLHFSLVLYSFFYDLYKYFPLY